MTDKKSIAWIWDGVGYLQGVPARDMTDNEWRALTEKQRKALAAHYTKKAHPAKAAKAAAED